ncbi:hypothetical protein GLI01_21090 [Gluconacetobacter liquefaciens]|nr:hypothetical protein GLI01_21090 [Gluconacetobacter liquefaciens]
MVAVAIASFREVRGANVVTVFPKQTGIVTIPRYPLATEIAKVRRKRCRTSRVPHDTGLDDDAP